MPVHQVVVSPITGLLETVLVNEQQEVKTVSTN